jgi:hypothetical protein
MNTDKLWRKLLTAAALMTLLLATACAGKNEIQSVDGQKLVEQGNAYMTCVKHADLGCAYALMSPLAQGEIDEAERVTQGIVDLQSVLRTYGPRVSEWTFDRAGFSTGDGKAIGSLEGKVQYADGKRGTVSLDFERSDGAWKVRTSNLHYRTGGIVLGLGK